jgi:biopolymer transport protein TolR
VSVTALVTTVTCAALPAGATIAIDTKAWGLALNRRRPSATELICKIDVSAFAGIMFALVAMFVLPATVVVDSPRDAAHMSVDLAKVSSPTEMRGADREDALVVAITRDGQVWFATDRITAENLPAAIRERVLRGAERRVYIKADMRARYGGVKQILASVHTAGI